MRVVIVFVVCCILGVVGWKVGDKLEKHFNREDGWITFGVLMFLTAMVIAVGLALGW